MAVVVSVTVSPFDAHWLLYGDVISVTEPEKANVSAVCVGVITEPTFVNSPSRPFATRSAASVVAEACVVVFPNADFHVSVDLFSPLSPAGLFASITSFVPVAWYLYE